MGNSSSTFIDVLDHISGHNAYMALPSGHNTDSDPRLPIELFDMVVEELADDPNTLSAVCRVCKDFVKPARKLLFRSIKVKYPPKSFTAFLQFLTAHPELATLVQELSLIASAVNNHGKNVSSRIHRAILSSALLTDTLAQTRNLRSLSLTGVTLANVGLTCRPGTFDLDRLVITHPVSYGHSWQVYDAILRPFGYVGTLRIEQYTYAEPQLSPRGFIAPLDSPLPIRVKNVEIDAPDLTTYVLSMLTPTATVQSLEPHGTGLRSLDIAWHDSRSLSGFIQGSCSTLEHFKFDLSGWLTAKILDGHANQTAAGSIGGELNLSQHCPKLQAVTLRMAVYEVKKAPELTFASIASILRETPSSARKVVFRIDLGSYATQQYFAYDDDLNESWCSLGRQVAELARFTTIGFEFRTSTQDAPIEDEWRVMVDCKLLGALPGVFMYFRYKTYDG